MSPCRARCDGQAEPRAGRLPLLAAAGPGVVEAHEPVQHPVPVGGRHPGPVVDHQHLGTRAHGAHPHQHPPRPRDVAPGVVEQVGQHLGQPLLVATDGAGLRVHGDLQPGSEQPGPLHLCVHECTQVHGPGAQLQPGVDPRQREQVLHEPSGAAGLPHHEQLHPLGRRRIGPAAGREHRLGGGLHPGQGGAQLVRSVGDEPSGALLGGQGRGLGPLERVQHLVEGRRRAAELGVGAVGVEPAPSLAARDGTGHRRHPVQRAQGGAGGQQQEQSGEHEGPHQQRHQHPAQLRPHVGDPGGVHGHGQQRAVGELAGQLLRVQLRRHAPGDRRGPRGGMARTGALLAAARCDRLDGGVADHGPVPGDERGGDPVAGGGRRDLPLAGAGVQGALGGVRPAGQPRLRVRAQLRAEQHVGQHPGRGERDEQDGEGEQQHPPAQRRRAQGRGAHPRST